MTAWGVFASMTYVERGRVKEGVVRVVTTELMPTATHVVIITMWAILVAVLVSGHVLAKGLLAFFTDEGHFCRSRKRMRLRLCMTFRAVEPLLAAWGADGDLRV
jgi:hypothetical protein